MTAAQTLPQNALQKPKGRLLMTFLVTLGMGILLFLPFIIMDRGYFIYYGDFNVQQIAFYRLAHDCVREGNIFWNWTTDLGANFIGSYSFYLLGSPFFWLTLPFPSAAVPYLMGPLLMLKFACAGTAAYALLRRFVRPNLAMLGGILYAFSGFSIYNVFFNHFHEAIVYFPLMLLGLELYMKDNRRGFFALMVFFSALSNYYFFIGQVFFILIYWFVRMFSGEWQCTVSKFLWLFFEAVIGTAGAAVFLLPSYFAVIQNPRTESLIAGWDFLLYSKPQRIWDILHSFFFPQDIPARENFFPDSDNKWSSMSAWLPVFGCSGAIAYFQSRKHSDWLHRILIICFFCAVIPGFNAMFQLFNWVYYARWYYMMVLMLVIATALCFEEADKTPVNWTRAFGWTFGITLFFTVIIGFMPESWTPDEETGKLSFGLMKLPERFWLFVAIALISLLIGLLLVLLFKHERRQFARWSIVATVCVSLLYSWYLIGLGKVNSNFSPSYVIDRCIEGADKFDLPDSELFVRVDMNEGMDNQGMFWNMPTINAFHSIVPGSVMEFYPTIGVSRSVGSRPDTSHYALRGLTSVRWLFDYDNEDGGAPGKSETAFFETNGKTKMPGWKYYDTQNHFRIYENEYYIPMGFTYEYYLTRTEYEALSTTQRELALLKAIVLEDEDVDTYAGILKSLTAEGEPVYSQTAYFTDCLARRASAASSFAYDNRGFTATITLPQENLVFFSVPYEDGWSATVNGEPAEVIKTNVGFMAVRCPAGEAVTIRFDYMTPGLIPGLLISGVAVLLFVLYLVLYRLYDRRRAARVVVTPTEDNPDSVLLWPAGEADEDTAVPPGDEPPAEVPPSPEDPAPPAQEPPDEPPASPPI